VLLRAQVGLSHEKLGEVHRVEHGVGTKHQRGRHPIAGSRVGHPVHRDIGHVGVRVVGVVGVRLGDQDETWA